MARNEVHTVPTDKGWANKVRNREVSNHRTKSAAEAAGRKLAKSDRAEHVIHKKDGTIGEKNSYGNDPARIKG